MTATAARRTWHPRGEGFELGSRDAGCGWDVGGFPGPGNGSRRPWEIPGVAYRKDGRSGGGSFRAAARGVGVPAASSHGIHHDVAGSNAV